LGKGPTPSLALGVRPQHAFATLIPAHNEASTLPATLAALARLDYPADRVRVCVVADNCTDRTAAVARSAGAVCAERFDGGRHGKGFAVAFGLDHIAKDEPDVVLILDADCELNPEALRELDAAFAAGADVVQTAVRSRNADDGPAGYVAAVGAAVDDGIAAGCDRLGLSVPLRGTGMTFRREVLGLIQWGTASPVEDAEYGAQLRAAGVRVRYCSSAVVRCDAPATVGGLCRQRRRWRTAGGLLWSKPLVLVHLLITVVVCVAAGQFLWWAAGLVLLTAGVYLRAMAAVGLTWKRLGLLLATPAVVLRLVGVTLAGMIEGKPATWDRTPRLGERQAA
jgi:cellulose synthase/poly-beta-1,6-N-acetylglucosamine synthase-like glycosyltransferase